MTEPLTSQQLRNKARLVELESLVGVEQPKSVYERLRELEELAGQDQEQAQEQEQEQEHEQLDELEALEKEALQLLIKKLKE